jgi:hypothetical protein
VQVLDSKRELGRQLLELESRYDEKFSQMFRAIRELMSEQTVPLKRMIELPKKDAEALELACILRLKAA